MEGMLEGIYTGWDKQFQLFNIDTYTLKTDTDDDSLTLLVIKTYIEFNES